MWWVTMRLATSYEHGGLLTRRGCNVLWMTRRVTYTQPYRYYARANAPATCRLPPVTPAPAAAPAADAVPLSRHSSRCRPFILSFFHFRREHVA
jgi:hypothetical protein